MDRIREHARDRIREHARDRIRKHAEERISEIDKRQTKRHAQPHLGIFFLKRILHVLLERGHSIGEWVALHDARDELAQGVHPPESVERREGILRRC